MTEPTFTPKSGLAAIPAWKWAAGAAVFALVLVLPHLGFTKNIDGPLPLNTIVLCGVYMLFALGLNIVVGYAGLLDLGFVAFFLFGAYTAAWLMSDFAINVTGRTGSWSDLSFSFLSRAPDGALGIHISFWLVIVVAGVIAAIAGVLIGLPTLKLKSDYLALVTLGFGEILPEVFRNFEKTPTPFGEFNLTNGTKGVGPVDAIGLGVTEIGKTDAVPRYYVVIGFCAVFVWVSLKLRDGRLGRAWMAIREDELAASLMGVPLRKAKLQSYAVGAIAGGVGGAFYATVVGTVNVDTFTFQVSIIVLCAVILGGMGNVWGVMLGAFLIQWLSDNGLKWGGRELGQLFGSEKGWDLVKYQFGLFGLILVLMMLFRPDGLIPAARTSQVKKADATVTAGDAQ
jgi:branched-chain amino acid transport system permease protein